MARLTAAQRKAIPAAQFGLPSKAPGSGSYPMPDKKHAVLAKQMAAAHASPADRKRIDARANYLFPGAGASKLCGLGSMCN